MEGDRGPSEERHQPTVEYHQGPREGGGPPRVAQQERRDAAVRLPSGEQIRRDHPASADQKLAGHERNGRGDHDEGHCDGHDGLPEDDPLANNRGQDDRGAERESAQRTQDEPCRDVRRRLRERQDQDAQAGHPRYASLAGRWFSFRDEGGEDD